MTVHLERDLNRLRKNILKMGLIVEETTNKSIESLYTMELKLAGEVIRADYRINEMELDIEEECLKILALHQPVAGDLRFIVAVLKVNNDLERVADLAQNIAERVQFLAQKEPLPINLDFQRMADIVRLMLRKSLDALVKQDLADARKTIAMDDAVDRLNAEMFTVLQELMMLQPDTIERAVSTLSVSRYLERIADLATNIAEYVIFMEAGTVVRHQLD